MDLIVPIAVVGDLTVQMDLTIPSVIIIDCIVVIKIEKNIFYSFNKFSLYEEISQVEIDLQLQTEDKLSLYGHYKSCQKLMSNSL